MTTKKQNSSVEFTNRQWAWQFLRRNQCYREAYGFLSSLKQIQLSLFFQIYDGRISGYSEIWSELATMPLRLFDRRCLPNCRDESITLDDFVNDQHQYLPAARKTDRQFTESINQLVLRISPEFRIGQYGLSQWINPEIENATAEQANNFWLFEVPLESSLIRTSWLDDEYTDFDETDWTEIFGKQTKKKTTSTHALQVKKRLFQSQTLPIIRGVDGSIFITNEFTSPIPASLPYGETTWPGRNPGPLSVEGNELVRATFDLSLPIEYQLEEVKTYLLSHQKNLQKAGFISELPSRMSRYGVFASYLAILDLNAQGLSDLDIAVKLKNLEDETYTDAQGKRRKSYVNPLKHESATSQQHTSAIRKQLERARYLRDHGYRSLALQIK